MSRSLSSVFLCAPILLALILAEPSVAGQSKGKGVSSEPKNESVEGIVIGDASYSTDGSLSAAVTVGISFGDARKLAVENGLTGFKPLPPGIRKNLERGKPVPPGIAKTRMPDSFVNQLPHHDGYEWRRAGVDLVLIATGSLIVSDVLEHVFD